MQCMYVSGANLCHGNFKPELTEVARLSKNKFSSPSGEIVAILDKRTHVH